jgi:hypothetical protein
VYTHNTKSNAKSNNRAANTKSNNCASNTKSNLTVHSLSKYLWKSCNVQQSEVDFAHVTLDSPEIHMQLVGPIASLLPISSGATGISNGEFTITRNNGVEVALRGKLRYNAAGHPENTFNYDGDHTYHFPATAVFTANQFGASNGQ